VVGAQRKASGPEGRQEVAPTVRSGVGATKRPAEGLKGRHKAPAGIRPMRCRSSGPPAGSTSSRENPWP